MDKPHNYIDMTGWYMKDHGVPDSRITVLCLAEPKTYSNGRKRQMWKCVCDCGTIFEASGTYIRNGTCKSCGCLHREIMQKMLFRHGECLSRLHSIWNNMRQRCLNPSANGYENYGGRGILVCDEWKEYVNFRDWALSNGYADNMSIDRIDVNGNYEPSNCRWANKEEQANNTRRCKMIEWNGQTKNSSQWAKITGINRKTIVDRIDRLGWSVQDALTVPPDCGNRVGTADA